MKIKIIHAFALLMVISHSSCATDMAQLAKVIGFDTENKATQSLIRCCEQKKQSNIMSLATAQSVGLVNKQYSLLQAIDGDGTNSRTKTEAGRLMLAYCLVSPYSCKNMCEQSQSIIKKLVGLKNSSSTALSNVQAHIAQLRSYEKMFAGLKKGLDKYVRSAYFYEGIETSFKDMNTRRWALVSSRLWAISGLVLKFLFIERCFAALQAFDNGINTSWSAGFKASTFELCNVIKTASFLSSIFNPIAHASAIKEAYGEHGYRRALVELAKILYVAGAVTFDCWGRYWLYFNGDAGFAEEEVVNRVQAIKKLCKCCEDCHNIFGDIPHCADNNILLNVQSLHAEIDAALDSNKIVRIGCICALYRQIIENPELIKKMMRYVALCDAYSSVAEFVFEHENSKKMPVSFTKFTDGVAINLTDAWSACGVKSPVLNDITMGEYGRRIKLLVAPNSSGKSVLLKLLVHNAALQSFGIVCAQDGTMPVFENIGAYVRVSENGSLGYSTGAAQTHALNGLIEEIDENKKSLLVIDEPLAGTPEWLARVLLEPLFDSLEANENTLGMLVTHFDSVAAVEQMYDSFEPCHMAVEHYEYCNDHEFEFLYKLIQKQPHDWWFAKTEDAEVLRTVFAQWYSKRYGA